uniref:AB hydrolase-1 domain-containing protein n=1 Tax=Seriola lalandi dorsalis TaxID=1841481 RepID=A0A3B4WVM4_SERLL
GRPRAGQRVCVFDNRGVGSSSVPDGPYSTEAMAEDTIALMDHLGWRRAHIVGFSLGGMVAMKLASLNRHRIKSLALISTHTGVAHAHRPPLPLQ